MFGKTSTLDIDLKVNPRRAGSHSPVPTATSPPGPRPTSRGWISWVKTVPGIAADFISRGQNQRPHKICLRHFDRVFAALGADQELGGGSRLHFARAPMPPGVS